MPEADSSNPDRDGAANAAPREAPVHDAEAEPESKPPLSRRIRGWAFDLLIVIVVIAGISAWQGRNLLPSGGEPAPEFTLLDLDGNAVSLSDYEGKAVQLHFWATWCAVCRREHGALNAMARRVEGADDRALLTIAVDSGSAAEIAAYAEEKGLEYPILIDDGTIAAAYQVSAFPTDYALDREHRISGSKVGYSTRWGMGWRLGRAAR